MTSAADAERDVEASRGELDRTMDAIRDKMTPGQLLDEAMHSMGGAGQQVFSKFVDQAKENPMPLAVMGVGLAWLMTSNRNKASQAYPTEPRTWSSGDGAVRDDGASFGDMASERMGDARDAMQGAAAKASDLMDSARARVGDTTARMSDMAAQAKDRAADVTNRTQQAVSDLLEREPLLVAGIGLVVGLAIGASIPSTEVEDRTLGKVRDKVVDRTKAVASDTLDDLTDVAEAAYGSAKDALQGGDDGRSAAERAGDAVQRAVESASDVVRDKSGVDTQH